MIRQHGEDRTLGVCNLVNTGIVLKMGGCHIEQYTNRRTHYFLKPVDVTRFACAHGYALAQVESDCEGCAPEVLYFFEKVDGAWSMVGLSKSIDPALCEESRRLSFDQCEQLWTAFQQS